MGTKSIEAITPEEKALINQEGKPYQRWISGYLESIRANNQTISQVFQGEPDPNNSEHEQAIKAAKFFLITHAEQLKIQP